MRMRRRFGKAEKLALKFFQTKEIKEPLTTADEIKKLFHQHDGHLDYILLEGSLKVDLLKSNLFSVEEAAFLQTDPLGKLAFCQFAEFFMNGFKLGHQALDLSAHHYIIPIDNEHPFQPLSHSSVLYPKSYRKLYSLESAIAKCFQSCFSLQGSRTAGITVWNVTYKGVGK